MTVDLDRLVRPVASRLQANHMARLGIRNTMRVARAYNRLKFNRQDRWRRRLYATELDALLGENGPLTGPPIEMKDGWAIETSHSLPHLDRILKDADEIIGERAGVRRSTEGQYRSYFQDIWTPGDLERYPSFLDFATSSDVLATVSRYLRTIPVLSTAVPSGIRFVESNAAFDDRPDTPHDSQLYHIDYYSLPNVYVLVLLRDTTREHGPWTFVPRPASEQAAARLGYWTKRHGYRLSDEQIYSEVDPRSAIEFVGARGSVLFIESSGCFHFGSRNAMKPRFQLMLGYVGACRTDFTDLTVTPRVYPVRESDSRLRKLVLNRNLLP